MSTLVETCDLFDLFEERDPPPKTPRKQDDPGCRRKVADRLEDHILAYCRLIGTVEWDTVDLLIWLRQTRNVRCKAASPDRVLRLLAEQGLVRYDASRQGDYRVLWVSPVTP